MAARWPTSPGPTFDEAAAQEDTVEVPVQVNGNLRGKIVVPAGADAAALEAAARGRREGGRAG